MTAPSDSAAPPVVVPPATALADRADVLAHLIAVHHQAVARLAHRLLGWPNEVDDVVQDVFVAVCENLAKFRGTARIETWLYRITVNCCRRRQRRWLLERRWWWHVLARRPGADSPEDDDRQEQVREATRGLAARYREVVVLRYFEELTVDEIAGILEVKRGTVEVRLSRARRMLAERLCVDSGGS